VRLWNLPGQVVQLGVIFVAGAAAMALLRARFVPESFGELGHYRADAVDLIAASEIRYAGWQACALCHPEVVETKNASYHRNVTCEACHGPAHAHASDPIAHLPVVPRGTEPCLSCHRYLPSRPTGFPQVIADRHNVMRPCVTCHDPHDPTPPHRPGSCSACHATIARVKSVSHHAPLDCEVCHEAPPEHNERPRSHLPKKPFEREFCGECHARGAEPPASVRGVDFSVYDIPRVDLETHGGTFVCWQCHYQHSPEVQ
jgi:hypothetical protein